ncbi:expressed unknown protein [Seminavis robusta]|uniref:DEP domain-containing protein n=1 Tax=Seminavis robusta TaxID=568900 RepID=A0A9N8DIK4_9STRA|nr:expressed unknown protein [Seminavis robusta]|eukprot:Sro177_g077770.1 n/a (330) ;mRNA; r:47414-48403
MTITSTTKTSEKRNELIRLEVLAETMEEKLYAASLVHEHFHMLRQVPRSFYGSDVVIVLREILQRQDNNTPVTRDQAFQVGRKIETEFQFFSHVDNLNNNKKEKDAKIKILQDNNKDLYQFHHNLPVQVYKMKKKYPSLWDKAKFLEAHLDLKAQRQRGALTMMMTTVHKNCFVAKEAVDCWMDHKLVRSRGEAVYVMNKLIERVNFCRTFKKTKSTDKHEFQDDCQIYQLVPSDQRNPEPKKRSSRKPRKTDSSSSSSSSSTSTPTRPKKRNSVISSTDESSRTASTSSTGSPKLIKDKAYFKDRVSNVRNGVSAYHAQRKAMVPSTA